jgi:hypothetical protein
MHNLVRRRSVNLHVSDEQNGHAGIVLRSLQAEVCLKVVESRVDDSIAVKIVESVHEPQYRLSSKICSPYHP